MSDTMIRNHDGRFKNIVKATDRPKSISGFFAKIFLPKDYPRSVSEDYTRYQIWDSAQALCSSVTGALAIHSVFQGIGVGDSHASSLSATTNWIVRDGIGKIVSISFAYYKGSQIDADCKRFRLFADVVNDVALTLNIISAVLPPGVRPYIYCITSCCWALVGVAGGCSRTAMTIHQARRDNASDVQAKDQSQETLVGLVGLVFSYFLVPLVTTTVFNSCLTFVAFTFLHILFNWLAVRSLNMDVFNVTRVRILIAHYLKTCDIISIPEINEQEPIIMNYPQTAEIIVGAVYNPRNQIYFENNSGFVSRSYDEGRPILVHLFEENTSDELFELVASAAYLERDIKPNVHKIKSLKDKVVCAKYNLERNHFAPNRHRVLKLH